MVHTSSGVSALVCALMLGKRFEYGKEEMRPHNMTYTAIGAAMLWVGWFGFNAGSALAPAAWRPVPSRRPILPQPRAE